MLEYKVEVTDSRGNSLEILISLITIERGTWRALDNGCLCYQNGATKAGDPCPPSLFTYISLFGGNTTNDSKLVLHLDDFLGLTQVNHEGKGELYKQDYLSMEPGELSWRLAN